MNASTLRPLLTANVGKFVWAPERHSFPPPVNSRPQAMSHVLSATKSGRDSRLRAKVFEVNNLHARSSCQQSAERSAGLITACAVVR